MDLVKWYMLISLLTSFIVLLQGFRAPPGYFKKRSKCDMISRQYTVIDSLKRCSYYRCVFGRYIKKDCPSGRQLTSQFVKWGSRGYAYKYNPCGERVTKCHDVTFGRLGDEVVPVGLKPYFTLESCGIDLGIGLDISCSISDENKQLVKDFTLNIINRFKIGRGFLKVAGVKFAEKPQVIQFLDQSTSNQATKFKFKSMDLTADRCRTHTDDALAIFRDEIFSKERGNRPDKKDILVFMSDGSTYHGKNVDNNVYVERTKRIGRELREKLGVETFVLGMPTNKNKTVGYDEWMEIGGDHEHVITLASFRELDSKINELLKNSCKETILDPNFWN
ncbi:unnamed protein product [Owenia fusiformis]|uniref:VWFA domain-containing protein n=1 Tax=Owenia fusiformis TaxID=6347 RepID=A0A8S4NDM5_OWEFU|nr:unnamed protein product [Owenia fusiformis]